MQTPTTDQLRNRIDQGLTGEKVAMPDPATVPLGTDAEAGGAPPTVAERALEAKATPRHAERRENPKLGALIYLVLAVALALAIVWITATARG